MASQGGILWQVTWEDFGPSNLTERQEERQITLPLETAHLLHQLNEDQKAYNRAQEELSSQRHRLFSDWHKYMEAAYAPEASDERPSAQDIKAFIKKEITALEAEENATGTFDPQKFQDLLEHASALPEQEQNLAGKLTHSLWNISQSIHAHNLQNPKRKYALQAIAAPRYYEPAEPVVMLEGDAVAPGKRHGFEGHMLSSQPLNCTVADLQPKNAADTDLTLNRRGLRRYCPKARPARPAQRCTERGQKRLLLLEEGRATLAPLPHGLGGQSPSTRIRGEYPD